MKGPPVRTIPVGKFYSELEKKYLEALVPQFNSVHLSAVTFTAFTGARYTFEYHTKEAFLDKINLNIGGLADYAKKIDEDVRNYWKAGLEGLQESHNFCVESSKGGSGAQRLRTGSQGSTCQTKHS